MTRRGFHAGTIAFLLSLLVVGVGVGHADPLVITSGFLTDEEGNPPMFEFTGGNFDIRAMFLVPTLVPVAKDIGPLETCFTCAPGTAIDLSSRASGAIGEWMSLAIPIRFQGAEYANVFFSGDVNFDAPTVTAPEVTVPLFFDQHVIAPFLFHGQLAGFSTPERTGPSLFAVGLTGRGDVDVTLSPLAANLFAVEAINYRFSSAASAPTPEPAPLLLVGGWLLGAQAIRRRRRQGRA